MPMTTAVRTTGIIKMKKQNAWPAIQTRYWTIRTKFSKHLSKLKLPSGSGAEVALNREYEELRWLVSH